MTEERVRETWDHNYWPKGGKSRLTRGTLCEDAETVFMAGHCHCFAAAVYEIEGWDVVGVWEDREMVHVMTVTPEGYYFDVRGRLTEEQALDTFYEDARIEEIDWLEIEEQIDDGNYRPLCTERAMPYAEAALRGVRQMEMAA